MVYVLQGISTITEEVLAQVTPLLSAQRREKIARYRFHKDRVQSAFAYLLLRYALKREAGFEGLPMLEETEGKPTLKVPKGLHFNLSHCVRAVACGLSDTPVGVDVQEWSPRHLSVRNKVCTPEELLLLEGSNRPEADFIKLWTRKESYGKYTGQGIRYAMQETDLRDEALQDLVLETAVFPDFALSYCAERKLELVTVTVQELLEGDWGA